MSKIKMIALDIGGTILSDDNTISKENIKIINKLKLLGVKITLVTARMYSSTKYISKIIGADYGVFSNGSIVMDINDKKTISTCYIPTELVNKVIDFAKKIIFTYILIDYYMNYQTKKNISQ